MATDTEDVVPFSLDEVNHIISNLNDKKAPGIDAISRNIVKHQYNAYPSLLLNINTGAFFFQGQIGRKIKTTARIK